MNTDIKPDIVTRSNWEHLDSAHDMQSINSTEQDNMHPETNKKKSLMFWFFIIGLFMLLAASLFAFYQYYYQNTTVSNEKISLKLNIDQNVKGGQQGTMSISVVNNNKISLSDTTLTVKTQKGLSRDGVLDQDISTYYFQTVNQGIYNATDTKYVFNGQEGEIRKIFITLEYKVAGSNSTFKKELVQEVKIISPSLILNVTGLSEIIENYEYLLKFKVKNIAYTSETPIALKIEAPTGFVVKKNDENNPTLVKISDLKVGEEKEYSLIGFFKNSLSSQKNFVATVSTYENGEIKSLITEVVKEVNLVQSPITYSYKIKVNNTEGGSFESNTSNVIALSFKNIKESYLSDVVVIMQNKDKKYTFNKANMPDLEKVNPAENRDIEIFLDKDIYTPNTNLKFEIYGKNRFDENSILLKKFELLIPTR